MDAKKRTQSSLTGARVSIGVNILLVLVKFAAGLMAGSLALVADAVHSASDAVTSVIIYVGIRVAGKPPDREHPYGHGKAESISCKIVSILVILAGLNIAAVSARALFDAKPEAPGVLAAWGALVSIAVKVGLYYYIVRIGKKHGSKILIANAYDHRTDAMSSAAALAGTAGARLGLHWGAPGFYYLDPLAGLLVSVLIIRTGYLIAKDAACELMDAQVQPQVMADLEQMILSAEGVIDLQYIRTRAAGPQVFIDLVIGVAEDLTVREGHEVAKRVKEELAAAYPYGNILIHVNPASQPGKRNSPDC